VLLPLHSVPTRRSSDLRVLRRQAGDHRGTGRGQQVVRRTDQEVDRLAQLAQLHVGTDGGELRDARPPRIGAPGFEVVEEEAVAHASGTSLHTVGAAIAAVAASQVLAVAVTEWPPAEGAH